MRANAYVCAVLVIALFSRTGQSSLIAGATITPSQVGPNSYEYSLTLTNAGTTAVGTFWFGWLPGYDLLPSAPTNITAPSGWTGKNAPDSFGVASVQWVATTPLQPGNSLNGFVFDSSSPPNVIGGTSAFFGLPVEQSYVYIGAPETDPGFSFVPTTQVPEPMSLALFLAAPLLLHRVSRRCSSLR